MPKTTTLRISYKTQEVLKKLKEIKQQPMNSIIHNLAEQELKQSLKLEEIMNGKNNSQISK